MKRQSESEVDAGSETPGEQPIETASQETPSDIATDSGASQDTPEQNAGVAAEANEGSETPGEQPAAQDASRTGFAERGQRAGSPCICPDGRTGTVHSFDAGLICIPNADQG